MDRASEEFDKELLFKALADRTRLRIINLIGRGEICVCFFVEVLRLRQSAISRHLAYLRKAGVVETRRDGKWVHYRIANLADPDAAHVFDEVRAWLMRDKEMQRDRERFLHFCQSQQVPAQLQSAPRPSSLSV